MIAYAPGPYLQNEETNINNLSCLPLMNHSLAVQFSVKNKKRQAFEIPLHEKWPAFCKQKGSYTL